MTTSQAVTTKPRLTRFGGLMIVAIIVFWSINFLTTRYMVQSIGTCNVLGTKCANIAGILADMIDLMIVIAVFKPETNKSDPVHVWGTAALWGLLILANASMTWWGVAAYTHFNHPEMLNAAVNSRAILAALSLFIVRVLLFGSFLVGGPESIWNSN